jgi:hypothetical protein
MWRTRKLEIHMDAYGVYQDFALKLEFTVAFSRCSLLLVRSLWS